MGVWQRICKCLPVRKFLEFFRLLYAFKTGWCPECEVQYQLFSRTNQRTNFIPASVLAGSPFFWEDEHVGVIPNCHLIVNDW